MHDAGPGSPYGVTAEIGRISDEVAPIAGKPVIEELPELVFQIDLGARLEEAEIARGAARLKSPDG